MSGPQDAQALRGMVDAVVELMDEHLWNTGDSIEGKTKCARSILAALTQSAPQAAPKDAESRQAPLLETGPFAYWVYVPHEQRGEFVHHLDDAIDDLTNCECVVTPLYEPAASIHPSAESEGSAEVAPVCGWKQEDGWDMSDCWNTDCGEAYSFSCDPTEDLGLRHCFYCGKHIKLVPFVPEADEDATPATQAPGALTP